MPRITAVRTACVGLRYAAPNAIERERRFPDGMPALRTYVPAQLSLTHLRKVLVAA